MFIQRIYQSAKPSIYYLAAALIVLLVALSLAALVGCGEKPEKAVEKSPSPAHSKPASYRETGDLDAIKKRGQIRFLSITLLEDQQLYRSNIVTLGHYNLAMQFARRLGLEAVWVRVDTAAQAIDMLERGEADVMPDNMTDTEQRRERINFTVPLAQIHQQLVTGTSGPDISAEDKLRDLKFVVVAGSTHADTAKRLIEKYPGANLSMEEIVLGEKIDDLIDTVNEHPHTVTILDSNMVQGLREYRDDLRVGADVSELENIAWGYRLNSPALGQRLDNFLTKTLVKPVDKRIADWPQIKQSGVLRLLTYNGPTGYFLWKGVLMGFDFDLAKAFAKKHGLQLQIVAVPFDKSLVEWLKEGRGDIAGAFSTFTPERKAQGVVFSTPYAEMAEQVLSNSGKPKIATLQDLEDRTLTLRAHSPFSESARILKNAGARLEVAPPDVSYLQLISLVAEGKLDATIMDAHTAQIESSLRPELQAGVLTSDPRPKGWMLLPQNRELLREVNSFISEFRQSKSYGNMVKLYLEPDSRYRPRMQARILPGADISPYDNLVRGSSSEHEFDWRLVMAQMWQESNFNPKAVSPVGAQGLLQVMPRTAEEMGYPPPLFDPERGIKAGVKYLRWVHDRFPDTLALDNKLWFSLASYNAGYGHLLDARRLAKQLGRDPDVWFDNVEVAMLKLSEPRYFQKARYGYVRGAEPVLYVRNISALYKAYTDVVSGETELESR